MAVFLFADNARSVLSQPIGPGQTQILLAPGGGAKFPSPGAGQLSAITLNDEATGTVYETCWCTARAGDTLTVLRGQEGTTANSWAIGDNVYCGPTKGQQESMVQYDHMRDASIAPVFAATQVFGNLSTSGNANVGGIGTFNDPNTAGVYITGTGSSGAGLAFTGQGWRKWIRVRVNGVMEWINNAYNAVIATLDDVGNFNVSGSIYSPNTVTGAQLVQGASVSAYTNDVYANGNVHGNQSVYATNGSIFVQGNGSIFTQGTGNVFASNGSVYANGAGSVFANGTGSVYTVNGNVQASGGGSVLSANNISTYGGGSIFTAAGNIYAQGGGSIYTTGNGGIFTSSGNITAQGGRLRATYGALGSGDSNAACILNDFPSSLGGGYFYTRLPNGLIIQAFAGGTSNNGIGEFVTFPIAFPNICCQVVITESHPVGWMTTPTPLGVSVFGAQDLTAGGFSIYTAHWLPPQFLWQLAPGIGYRYIAVGF